MEKKKNIWLYFIKMFILFMFIFFLSQLGSVILENSFKYLKYGPEIISQSIWAVLVVVVVFTFKNSYIFTEKREPVKNSIKLGWPLLAIGLIYFILNIVSIIVEGKSFDIPVILNLATFCLLIGIVEEFLCRGWLLNEFLERFSNTKKNIMLSIILSSIVFGFIHIFNVTAGQSLADTIVQIINATFFGIALGLIYYKTKNIWGVVLIHAIWDFCLMIGDSTILVDCVTGETTSSIILYDCIISVIIVIAAGCICYWVYKQTDLNDEKRHLTKSMYYILPLISAILYIGSDFVAPEDYENYYHCPTYETKKIAAEYEVQYYSHSKYDLEYSKTINMPNITDEAYISNMVEKHSFSLLLNEETYQIELHNNNTKEKIVLTDEGAYDYLLIENEDSYVILIQNDYNRVLYGIYQKAYITNDNSYLENVKEQLTEYIVPTIDLIGSLTLGTSEYKYAQIQTTIYDKLYFDETGTLYIATQE